MKLPGNQKSKLLPLQCFSFYFQQEGFQSHAIRVLLGAGWPFPMGIGVASPTTSKFNDSNFNSHSRVMCYQTKNPGSIGHVR